MNPILLDLVIAAVILLSALMGRKKGFVLSLCGLLALFVALIGAAVLTGMLAPHLTTLALPFVENYLTELVQTHMSGLYAEAEGAVHATLDQLLSLMEQSDTLSVLSAAVTEAVERGALEISGDALRSVARYLAEQLTRIVLFPIFFALIMLAWTALSHVLDLAFRLPGLNFLNRMGGLLLGLVRGLLLVFAAYWLLKDSFLSHQTVEASFLLPLLLEGAGLLSFSSIHS